VISWDVVVTGTVGIAGIAGTLWQGKRSREAQSRDLKLSINSAAENLRLGLKAEDERAKLAEKRRIYALYVTSIDSYADKAIAFGASLKSPDRQTKNRALKAYVQGGSAISVALAELMLIAPESVGSIARDIFVSIGAIAVAGLEDSGKRLRDDAVDRLTSEYSKLPGKYHEMANQLYDAMRRDLGEDTWRYRT
jgi:hypothetical protein